jgi:hypothetical protein
MEINAVRYHLRVLDLIAQYLHTKKESDFLDGLNKLDRKAKREFKGGKNKNLWYRFPSDSTLVTNPQTLAKSLKDSNRKHTLDCLELSRSGNIEIHYS